MPELHESAVAILSAPDVATIILAGNYTGRQARLTVHLSAEERCNPALSAQELHLTAVFEVTRMRTLMFIVLALSTLAVVSSAQEDAQGYESTPTFEVSAGYDYVRYNADPKIPGVPMSENVNGNGGNGQFAFNPYSHVGLVAEVGAYAISRQGFATTHEVSYLFGPRINLRRGRITPFVQTLLGRQWAEDGITFGSVSAYSMTVGGGIDVAISTHVAIRPAQVEYFLTKFNDGNNNQQNNFRFGTGIVFRFAQK